MLVLKLIFLVNMLYLQNFLAMHKLGIFNKHFKEFVNSTWKIFCQKIIHSSSPTSVVYYRSKDFDGFITFVVKKDITETSTPNPAAVFE